jgi:iron(II)-dependent oxidoreductase
LITIPAGPFLMGDDEYSDANPQHEVTLPEFKFGKYPVTNAQYLRFIEETGREWHSSDGRNPNNSTCPATDLTWYDARAYCEWLTKFWRNKGRISDNETVRLPTEAEWEKAARGTDGRVYPWGNDWHDSICNTYELGLHDTTPVGIFPEGASPYRCLDMAGNVCEWTSSLWGKDWEKPEFKYPYKMDDVRENLDAEDDIPRVLRGGSWSYFRDFAQCTSRIRNVPYFRSDYSGFRVVVPPISAL